MTIADVQDKSLARLEIKPHPTIAELDAEAERIETPLQSGGRIVWRKWGKGPPLAFCSHGGSGSWTHWIRNIPVMSRNYSVYAVDLPGMGDSDPFSGEDLELRAGEHSDFRDPLDPAWQPPPIAMAALSRILAQALEAMIPREPINLRLLLRRHDSCPTSRPGFRTGSGGWCFRAPPGWRRVRRPCRRWRPGVSRPPRPSLRRCSGRMSAF